MSKNENGRRVRINEDAKDFAKLEYKSLRQAPYLLFPNIFIETFHILQTKWVFPKKY